MIVNSGKCYEESEANEFGSELVGREHLIGPSWKASLRR
jgi:hypothetical protein